MAMYRYECIDCGEITEVHRNPEHRHMSPPCRCGGTTGLCIGTSAEASRSVRSGVAIRRARPRDTSAINFVVESAIDSWPISERVKRLARPLYQYDNVDLHHYDLLVADQSDHAIVGVASWSAGKPSPDSTACLQGLFVDAAWHRRGVGVALLEAVVGQAGVRGSGRLALRATRSAENFFLYHGFRPDADEPALLYPRYMEKAL